MSRFERALELVLGYEGGESDDPNDRGGLTLQGITQAAYDRYRDGRGLDRRPVTDSTDEERRTIYREDYWDLGRCGDMAWPLGLVHFDSMVQHGRAPWLLQEALQEFHPQLLVDGVVGRNTLAAARDVDGEEGAEALLRRRLRYYAHLVTDEGRDDPDKVFAGGWINRVADLWEAVEGEES